jgi:hypothetical protein
MTKRLAGSDEGLWTLPGCGKTWTASKHSRAFTRVFLPWLQALQVAHVLALELEGGAARSRESQPASTTRGLPGADRGCRPE